MIAPAALWDRPIREFPNLINFAPPVARPNDSITAVVDVLSRDPAARMAFVLDEDDKLLGAISEPTLDLDLITLVLPEHLWSSIHEMDRKELVRAARGRQQTARAIMSPTKAITGETTLKDALSIMARANQTVLPLIDEQGRLLGYASVFKILAHLMRHAA